MCTYKLWLYNGNTDLKGVNNEIFATIPIPSIKHFYKDEQLSTFLREYILKQYFSVFFIHIQLAKKLAFGNHKKFHKKIIYAKDMEIIIT